jgi:membrane associated rhomboid family serine protease
MIPLRDLNPTRSRAVMTVAIIAVNTAAFLAQISRSNLNEQLDLYRYGVIPKCFLAQGSETKHEEALLEGLTTFALQERLSELQARGVQRIPPGLYDAVERAAEEDAKELRAMVGPRHEWLTLLTAMFMHGGWFHLIGNMWFLWIFGNNIEDACGRGRFIAFYLICGLVAMAGHIAASSSSVLPTIGASGAISGVLGAYILLYPRATILTVIPIWLWIPWLVEMPAWVFLGVWILIQFLGGLPSLHNPAAGGTAWFAHIGGFAAGMALIHLFRRRRAAPPSGIEFELDDEEPPGNSGLHAGVEQV